VKTIEQDFEELMQSYATADSLNEEARTVFRTMFFLGVASGAEKMTEIDANPESAAVNVAQFNAELREFAVNPSGS
jgi:hypothetical protein